MERRAPNGLLIGRAPLRKHHPLAPMLNTTKPDVDEHPSSSIKSFSEVKN